MTARPTPALSRCASARTATLLTVDDGAGPYMEKFLPCAFRDQVEEARNRASPGLAHTRAPQRNRPRHRPRRSTPRSSRRPLWLVPREGWRRGRRGACHGARGRPLRHVDGGDAAALAHGRRGHAAAPCAPVRRESLPLPRLPRRKGCGDPQRMADRSAGPGFDGRTLELGARPARGEAAARLPASASMNHRARTRVIRATRARFD